MKKLPTTHRIAFLFNTNTIYDRGIIMGIGNYLSSTWAQWVVRTRMKPTIRSMFRMS